MGEEEGFGESHFLGDSFLGDESDKCETYTKGFGNQRINTRRVGVWEGARLLMAINQ